jgi:hypothetical protein
MALTYLSGDNYGAIGKKKSGGGGGGSKRSAKKQARQTKRAPKKQKRAEKKQTRQTKRATKKASGKRGQKIKKVGVAPARAAFLTAVNLNLLKTANKLARVWNKPNGKERLKKFWVDSFGGDLEVLKKAIIKGSKQQISGERIGVATEVVLATATPILIAVAKIFSEFKAGGDQKEREDFDKGVNDAKEELANSPEFESGTADMGDKEVGVVDNSGGESGGGGGGSSDQGGGGSSDEGDGEAGGSKGKTSKADSGDTMKGLNSPLGFYFKMLLILMILPESIRLNAFTGVLTVLCTIGLFLTPFSYLNGSLGKYAALYVRAPFNTLKYFGYGKNK